MQAQRLRFFCCCSETLYKAYVRPVSWAFRERLSNHARYEAIVQFISPDLIDPNPENPRLIFSDQEMIDLLKSIDERGVIVPLIVYKDDGRYKLLDGERRLRCALRLNLKAVPANIIAKPSPMENILQMFHIHNVREDWELIETAKKLDVLLKDPAFQGKNNSQIGKLTGLSPSTVSRCKILLSLSDEFREMIFDTYRRIGSGEKIDADRLLTEDFFIESNLAMNSITTHFTDPYDPYGEYRLLHNFVEKRKTGVFSNVAQVGRMIPKVVGPPRKGASSAEVINNIKLLVEDPDFTIRQAFDRVAAPIYTSVDIQKRSASLIEDLLTLAKMPKKDLTTQK